MIDTTPIKTTFENQVQDKVITINQFVNVPNNTVFKVETASQNYIFKVYSKNDWPEDGKIPFIYRKLAENNIPHAKLYMFNREDRNFPNGYLIEECLTGTTADKLTLTEEETVMVFTKLARLISQVHKIEMVNFGYIGNGEPAIWTTFSEFMYDVLSDNSENLIANGFIKAEDLKEVNHAIYTRLKPFDVFPSVLCHGDLSAKNILVNSDKITLIDWDDSQSLSWVADIARLTFWLKLHYGEQSEAIYRKVFLDNYETSYDKNAFYELEDVLHVWYGLDYLTFFTKGAECERTKILLQDSRNKCGI